MGKFMNNGYDVISNISRCYSDYEEEILQMELELRKLEAVNDSLQDENDRLRAELHEAAEFKADEGIAEIKRMILNAVEEISAEDLKKFVVRVVTEALMGDNKCRRERR